VTFDLIEPNVFVECGQLRLHGRVAYCKHSATMAYRLSAVDGVELDSLMGIGDWSIVRIRVGDAVVTACWLRYDADSMSITNEQAENNSRSCSSLYAALAKATSEP
jgi:hypothetical protein